jgi:hypothetical protein
MHDDAVGRASAGSTLRVISKRAWGLARRRVAVLLGAGDYDALRETIAVLGDAELVCAHAEGMAALKAGDGFDVDDLGRRGSRLAAAPTA